MYKIMINKPEYNFFKARTNYPVEQGSLNKNPMGTPNQIDVYLMLILRRYVEDQFSTNIHIISRYFFDVILLIEKSTLFPCTFLDIILLVKTSTFSPRSFFDVIPLVETSMLFPYTFFDVILMVKKSTLFARTFIDEISMSKNLTSLLVMFQVNENIRGGFPLLVTLKN